MLVMGALIIILVVVNVVLAINNSYKRKVY
jgi:hypothetical protein